MDAPLIAEIITVGDELTRGEIVDTNSAFLAAELWAAGVTVGYLTSCRDHADDMRAVLDAAAGRAGLILCSGGLGPTSDDLTVDVVAGLLGVAPVEDAPARARLEAYRGRIPLTPSNLRQLRVPAGAVVMANPAGAAPGFEVRLRGVPLLCFPGPPREMQAVYRTAAAARVAALAGPPRIVKRIHRVFGLGESMVANAVDDLIVGVEGASLHYQVVFPETLVKLVVRGADRAAAEATIGPLDAELVRRLGAKAYGDADDCLAAACGRALARRGATLAVAESCTGGMLGSLITDVPGSSAWFVGGFITYTNEAKVRDLGVAPATLAAHGAVSAETVREMAAGARARTGATFAAAISGVAGPDGGTPDKPVGTVHIAVAGPTEVRHKLHTFGGARDQVRRLAAYWAMAMVIDLVDNPAQP
jgi:nicotinamide-nucleotide amidase